MNSTETTVNNGYQKWYMPYLLIMAGVGGLLYGIDVGVIAGALPFLEAVRPYTPGQLSIVVAAVLLGSVLSSLFAGALSDLLGRKAVMIIAGVCFVASVPVICIPTGYEWLVAGRLLQGVAGGLIGVVVPLYLAECLTADKRGSGTGMFQFLLTVGLVFAAAIGFGCAYWVESVVDSGATADVILNTKDIAWKAIFWVCAIPGVLFTIGCFFVSESPRWLFAKGKKEEALKVLQRSREGASAQIEYDEMAKESNTDTSSTSEKKTYTDSLFSKKYVVPFIIAVVILACNQATGINSVLAYIVNILNQAGLPGSLANQGDLAVKVLNCLMTVVAVMLVDRKGRKFLLTLGTSGIIIALLGVAFLFRGAEAKMEDYTQQFNAEVVKQGPVTKMESRKMDDGTSDTMAITYDMHMTITPEFINAITDSKIIVDSAQSVQVKMIYAYGDIETMKSFVIRVPEMSKKGKLITFNEELKASNYDYKEANKDNKVSAFFRDIHMNPFPNPASIDSAGLSIVKFEVGPVPDTTHGWLVTIFFIIFISSFAVGPGVCVWLALSELMPTRIRSNGMSIALLINQFVSTAIAAVFLPVVGAYGYSTIFFFCAGCTVIYFITAVFFLPETKGKTLEEIEAYFEGKKKAE